MPTVWFIFVALMLTGYVVLDGFDIGAGIIHLLVAKNNDERRLILRSIGPVWDGNEVWLVAGAGTIFFAFPLLYASSFSGFYLPLNIVLWLLISRAVGIEFRLHLDNQVWRDFFDGLFSMGSALLGIFFGIALGNVVRGVPLSRDGYFFEPLWTDFRAGPGPGILDWYTMIAGLVALVALAIHGSHYIVLKTTGPVRERSRKAAARLYPFLIVLTVISLMATLYIRPGLLQNYKNYPVGFLIPVAVFASLSAMVYAHKREQERVAFLSSSAYLIAMLAGAAFALYPNLLPASTDPAYSLTVQNSAAAAKSLSLGLVWWTGGMLIAIGYFVFIYRMFRGKVQIEDRGHGY